MPFRRTFFFISLVSLLGGGCLLASPPANLGDTGAAPDVAEPDTARTDTGSIPPDTRPQDAGPTDADAAETCVPKTCESVKQSCGTVANGCGGTLECGGCGTVASIQTRYDELIVGKNTPYQFEITVHDEAGQILRNPDVRMRSDNPSVVQVDEATVTVTGKSVGGSATVALEAGTPETGIETKRVPVHVIEADFELPHRLHQHRDFRLWMRADAGVGTKSRSSKQLDRWESVSFERGRLMDHVFEPATRSMPELDANFGNGRPALDFDGTSELRIKRADLNDLPRLDDATILIVAEKKPTGTKGQLVSTCGAMGGNNQIRFNPAPTEMYIYRHPKGGEGTEAKVTGLQPTTRPHLVTVRLKDGTLEIRQNGRNKVTKRFPGQDPWTFSAIGARCREEQLEGSIAEIMIFDRALSSAPLKALEQHLMGRYNLGSN